jgi:radical SAM superfamily enzyme YgiQ (UPF0313 family)
MNILLLSMPDAFEHMSPVTVRMPNGALGSLAGNLDDGHRVAIADLILAREDVRGAVERLLQSVAPDVVGLSVMTFQRRTAHALIRFIRARRPRTRIVVGGYDPSLAPEAYTDPSLGVDAIVRGEGEATFRELVRALAAGAACTGIAGAIVREGTAPVEAPRRPVRRLDGGTIGLPDRSARVLGGYTLLGRPVDVVETSRGCTYDCSFCSIIEMRGRNFHRFPIPRVLADIADARARGARCVFFVDDNVTLDMPRFEALCRAIVAAGLNDVDYVVQGMTSAFARHGQTVAPLMRRAGFRYVFLGIENVLDGDLVFLRASAKNRIRVQGQADDATLAAVEHVRRNGMYVVGGLIVGNPDDTPEAIEANLRFARRHVDWPYIQHPTPYPGTPMTRDFEARGLVVNRRAEEYDGTTAVVRTSSLDAAEIEFLRWRAERWMKLAHLPAALAHSPRFVLRHGWRMLRETFHGSSLRSCLGLEDSRAVFERHRRLRLAERAGMWRALEQAVPASARASPGREPVRTCGARPTRGAASRRRRTACPP